MQTIVSVSSKGLLSTDHEEAFTTKQKHSKENSLGPQLQYRCVRPLKKTAIDATAGHVQMKMSDVWRGLYAHVTAGLLNHLASSDKRSNVTQFTSPRFYERYSLPKDKAHRTRKKSSSDVKSSHLAESVTVSTLLQTTRKRSASGRNNSM